MMCSQFVYIFRFRMLHKGRIRMRKIYKNKKGFTLVEMIVVIAIIVLFSFVFYISVTSYLNRAKTAAEAIDTHNEAISQAASEVDVAG